MASKLFRNVGFKLNKTVLRQFSSNKNAVKNNNILPVFCALGGSVSLMISVYNTRSFPNVHAAKLKTEKAVRVVKLTSREKRFIQFASVEYDGQLYMTPQDFLESVVQEEPRPTMKRKILSQEDLEKIIDATPPPSQGSPRLFRSLREKGIISCTEYLFLRSILIKPQSGFEIAFNMFDTDGNQRVDKTEFLVLEKIFSHAWKGKRGITNEEAEKMVPTQEQYVDDEQGLQRRHMVDTTLIVHFFGPNGDTPLNFESFKRFMLHLQTEVLEMEFDQFSNGLMTISAVDFAKILLRYTYLHTDQYDMYIDRLLDRIKDKKGITSEEFHVFFQFLNNLEDFNIAVRMYTLANHPISEDEFHRAVKICTGANLNQHLVHTVFAMFDDDGDGLLSYREFIAIMKDRLHRGFKFHSKKGGCKAFKTCIKREMNTPT